VTTILKALPDLYFAVMGLSRPPLALAFAPRAARR